MNDYAELVKRLRDYSSARKGEIAALTGEAADAIETLMSTLDEYQRRMTGRMPKEGR